MPDQCMSVHSLVGLVGKVYDCISTRPVVAVFFGVYEPHLQVILRGDTAEFTFQGLPVSWLAG